ncbi:MAG: DNA-processing protein DprA [Calditerrivibrio sp.]|nr:DNA-processing protein DprA [Calditerrivibrio sp.]MCA1933526.1 DNA-processing protein DprA [Calditerrivibrio sp.]MCA1980984.1 DNA-processing protein DprA [Calditerrivibrio sp.]
MNNYDLVYNYLSLLNIKGISHKSIVNLVKSLGGLGNIFKIETRFLKDAGLNENQIELIKSGKIDEKFVEDELVMIKKNNIRMLLFEDKDYPRMLKEIDDPPAILYTYGNIETMGRPSLSVVGSRRASVNAIKFAKKLSSELGEIGFNIVSGYASGIDINAHLGAIEKGTTTAVFGNGLLVVYPSQHKKYLKEICEKGCIISELPLKEQPNAHNFPKRNRIISGLSYGVIVVEAYEQSGSLITAKLAIDYGRDLFAVPTWPENHNTGTNKLIKEGAKLIENYLDVVGEYAAIFDFLKDVDKKDNNTIISLNDEGNKLLEIIKNSPCSVDELCIKSGLPTSDILSILTEMELDDLVFLNSDGRYSIKNRR